MGWTVDQERISYRSNSGGIVFDDTLDHWENAVRRLVGMTDEQARAWVEAATEASERRDRAFEWMSPDEKLEVLAEGARHVLAPEPMPPAPVVVEAYAGLEVFGEEVDRIWGVGIREDQSVAVVGPTALDHGVLVRMPEFGGGVVDETVYEEDYFEGRIHGVGYGDYGRQKDWRMEKSRRQVRQIIGISTVLGRPLNAGAAVLDVGSGYGYFRQASEEQQFIHEGLDVSRHAAEAARNEFGFETFVGSLDSYLARRTQSFDLVCMFDTIEHVSDPLALIGTAAAVMKPGGMLVVRTPNLNAIEFDVFGRYYHSLKVEHLHYFSARSLCRVLASAGLIPGFLTSESHLLQGFMGEAAVQSYARTLRGSDLFAVAFKPD